MLEPNATPNFDGTPRVNASSRALESEAQTLGDVGCGESAPVTGLNPIDAVKSLIHDPPRPHPAKMNHSDAPPRAVCFRLDQQSSAQQEPEEC